MYHTGKCCRVTPSSERIAKYKTITRAGAGNAGQTRKGDNCFAKLFVTAKRENAIACITSGEYGRIIAGIVRDGLFAPGVHHIVPTGSVNKNELVQLIAANSGRSDIKIVPANSNKAVDRTLTTNDEAFNAKLWAGAGRATVPSVAELVAEI